MLHGTAALWPVIQARSASECVPYGETHSLARRAALLAAERQSGAVQPMSKEIHNPKDERLDEEGSATYQIALCFDIPSSFVIQWFQADATAWSVSHGQRYTLALTRVNRHESTAGVLKRRLARIRERGVKIQAVLLDRAFFHVPVVQSLPSEELPALMPVMFRGRRPKKVRTPSGLRWIQSQPAGCAIVRASPYFGSRSGALYILFLSIRNPQSGG